MQALTDREFSSLRELFYSLSSIWLGDEKKYLVQNRILKRLHYLHLKNYEEYYDFLMKKENKDELDIFVDLVTTHEIQHGDARHGQSQAFELGTVGVRC